MKRYQTMLSFTYDAESPEDAVKQFMANIPVADWYVEAKDIETGKVTVVDTETWETQPLGNED